MLQIYKNNYKISEIGLLTGVPIRVIFQNSVTLSVLLSNEKSLLRSSLKVLHTLKKQSKPTYTLTHCKALANASKNNIKVNNFIIQYENINTEL